MAMQISHLTYLQENHTGVRGRRNTHWLSRKKKCINCPLSPLPGASSGSERSGRPPGTGEAPNIWNKQSRMADSGGHTTSMLSWKLTAPHRKELRRMLRNVI
jgi:hypothetical protein